MLILPAGQRTSAEEPGRRTRHSLSFGPHYDPANLRFGLLVCHNDDLLQPGAGYPDHPHSNLEVVTWVLTGTLAHRDSDGHQGAIAPGTVQTMSAGSGLVHAEFADPASGPTRFIQAWVLPDEPGGTPSYASSTFAADRSWTPVASGSNRDAAPIGASGATLWVAHPECGDRLTVPEAPFVHLFVATGAIELASGDPAVPDAVRLAEGDAARLRDEPAELVATEASELLAWTFTR